MPLPSTFTVTVVIEGAEITITAEAGENYSSICSRALKEGGFAETSLGTWKLTNLAGQSIEFDESPSAEAELVFLSRGEEYDIQGWMKRLAKLYEDDEDYAEHESRLRSYLEKILVAVKGKYRIIGPYQVGGTGIVLRARHITMPQFLVIKFNRPSKKVYANAVENERQILARLNHENVVHILDMGFFSDTPPLSFIVEPFIPNARTLAEFLQDELKTLRENVASPGHTTKYDEKSIVPFETRELDRVLYVLTGLLHQWVKALLYLQTTGKLLYLDVKPNNALIDGNGHLYLIDFGSAKKRPVTDIETMAEPATPKLGEVTYGNVPRIDEYSDSKSTNVVYTLRYAHPRLRKEYTVTDPDRVVTLWKRNELTRFFDYYALGRSILELLNEIGKVSPNTAPQRPLFRLLNFLATRLLDGENQKSPSNDAANEIFGDLTKEDYKSLRYLDLSHTLEDLEKELGRWNPEKTVPELETYPATTLRMVSGLNTAMTPRLRSVMEHPIFARLKLVSQLGLVSLIYPTADHSRFDHALGTFTYCCSYVKSLFNDPQNPLFRNLIRSNDIEAVLLAALLHDLGQYPLAHDLEEVHDHLFNHHRMTRTLLEDKTRDISGRTLKQIITDKSDGWGVEMGYLDSILTSRSMNRSKTLDQPQSGLVDFKVDMLSALIDGPIDADKADYLTRDTIQCRVPYGALLDMDRLLRVLTIAVIESPPNHRVTVGVYEKGRPSAEAFRDARYMLFSSVYWHHTSRVLKAMLQYSVAIGLGNEILQTDESDEVDKIRDKLVLFLRGLSPPFANLIPPWTQTQEGVSKVKVDQPELIGSSEDEAKGAFKGGESTLGWYPGVSYTDWLMMAWLRDNLPKHTQKSRALLESVCSRRLYKRLVTLTPEDARQVLPNIERIGWTKRVSLCEEMQKRIEDHVLKNYGSIHTTFYRTKDEVKDVFSSNLAILVDIPNPDDKQGHLPNRPLMVVPELREKLYYQETNRPYPLTEGSSQMSSISNIRILCHPSLHQAIGATYRESSIRKEISAIIQEAWATINE